MITSATKWGKGDEGAKPHQSLCNMTSISLPKSPVNC